MAAIDRLSGSDEAFEALIATLLEKAPAGVSPAPSELAAAADSWRTARDAARHARTQAEATTVAKRRAREKAMDLFRVRIRQLRADPAVSDAILGGLGLRPRDRKPTRVPVPGGAPTLEIDPAGRGRHKVRFFQWEFETRRKPRGVVGIELDLMSPGLAAGERFSAWTFFDLLTRSPATIAVPLPGKMARYRARWRNTRGETGPWSETVECTVMA